MKGKRQRRVSDEPVSCDLSPEETERVERLAARLLRTYYQNHLSDPWDTALPHTKRCWRELARAAIAEIANDGVCRICDGKGRTSYGALSGALEECPRCRGTGKES